MASRSVAAGFGFSRPSFCAAQRALDEGGLQGLVPARPGPRGAHKLTPEVVASAREQRAADPKLSSARLVGLIAERFGVRVHRRSVEREPSGGTEDVARYEQLRGRWVAPGRVAARARGARAPRRRCVDAGLVDHSALDG